ncbi:GntR family transcriptional regulator [Chitinophaga caeni]|uniref:GntR family transcriptional regulator n=1 Tax=Chitinophaga caeni TaxID=2029983 RepID=A0A291QUY5_9BACT|nr:PLP-dependent aminotransferase family protein [Chitinophaga caeni]ATL47747.1 GntR family transcriptional regulator [Chitinophaga caeni]
MISLGELLSIDKQSDTPVYLQISNAIIMLVRRGIFKMGSKLPSSRDLAKQLSINRNTVNAAYEELAAQDWIEIRARVGYFISGKLPGIQPRELGNTNTGNAAATTGNFPLNELPFQFINPVQGGYFPYRIYDGFPDPRLAPLEALLREAKRQVSLASFQPYLRYGSHFGPAPLLDALKNYLHNSRGLKIGEDNLMVTNGAQMGIYLACKVLIKPGDTVIVGEPGYFIANDTFKTAGAKLIQVPVDNDGLQVENLERICKKTSPKLLYVIPHHHHPTTVTLSPERRLQLLALAAKYRFAILEDDYDYDYHYNSNPILPMASLDDHGNVIYIGTLNKLLVPAVRAGFMVGPKNFIQQAAQYRRIIDWQGNSFIENALATIIDNGTLNRHVQKVQKIYHERRDHFCRLLGDELGDAIQFQIPNGGMSVWTKFLYHPLKKISAAAAKKGLKMSDGSEYNTAGIDYNSLRIGFTSFNFAEQESVIKILRSTL